MTSFEACLFPVLEDTSGELCPARVEGSVLTWRKNELPLLPIAL